MYRRYLLLPLLAILLVACSADRTRVESDLGIRGAPDWVNQGSQALNDHGGRLFHGVGQAPEMGDASLQQSVADDRARAAIARVLSSFFDMAANDYAASSADGGDRTTTEAVSRQLRNSTRLNLSGARIIGRWKDPRTHVIYSLAELDMQQVKQSLGLAKDMNDEARQYFDKNADNVFDQMTGKEKSQ